MSDAIDVKDVLTDDQILQNNQVIRNKLVNKIIEEGIPTDQDTQYVLLTTMKDMDKQIIDKKRVAIEDKNSNVANIVAEAVIKIAGVFDNVDPFKRKSTGEKPAVQRQLIPDTVPVDGELEIGSTSETFDGFMSVHGKASKAPV